MSEIGYKFTLAAHRRLFPIFLPVSVFCSYKVICGVKSFVAKTKYFSLKFFRHAFCRQIL